jgi:hypothetical protein
MRLSKIVYACALLGLPLIVGCEVAGPPPPSPTPTPLASPEPAQWKKVSITLTKDGQKCKPAYVSAADKEKAVVGEDDEGVEWDIKNTDCKGGSWDLRLRGVAPGIGKKKLKCRVVVDVPQEVADGESVDPPPVCYFPGARKANFKKYEGYYVYEVRVCRAGTNSYCATADPEIEVKRR